MNARRDGYIAGLGWGRGQRDNGLVSMPLRKLINAAPELRPEGMDRSLHPSWRDGFVSGVVQGLEGAGHTARFQITLRANNDG